MVARVEPEVWAATTEAAMAVTVARLSCLTVLEVAAGPVQVATEATAARPSLAWAGAFSTCRRALFGSTAAVVFTNNQAGGGRGGDGGQGGPGTGSFGGIGTLASVGGTATGGVGGAAGTGGTGSGGGFFSLAGGTVSLSVPQRSKSPAASAFTANRANGGGGGDGGQGGEGAARAGTSFTGTGGAGAGGVAARRGGCGHRHWRWVGQRWYRFLDRHYGELHSNQATGGPWPRRSWGQGNRRRRCGAVSAATLPAAMAALVAPAEAAWAAGFSMPTTRYSRSIPGWVHGKAEASLSHEYHYRQHGESGHRRAGRRGGAATAGKGVAGKGPDGRPSPARREPA